MLISVIATTPNSILPGTFVVSVIAVAIAPAMTRAGRRQRTTCSLAYQRVSASPSPTADLFLYAAGPQPDQLWRGLPGGGFDEVAKAIDYMLKRWPAFTRFLADGRICLSNNAERALRGARYKVPKFLAEDLFWSRGFQKGVARLAIVEGEPLDKMRKKNGQFLLCVNVIKHSTRQDNFPGRQRECCGCRIIGQ